MNLTSAISLFLCTFIYTAAALADASAFKGLYRPSGEEFSSWDCASVGQDGGAIEITAQSIIGVESICELLNPREVDGMGATFFETRCRGEGYEWDERIMLMSSDIGVRYIKNDFAVEWQLCVDPSSEPVDANAVSEQDKILAKPTWRDQWAERVEESRRSPVEMSAENQAKLDQRVRALAPKNDGEYELYVGRLGRDTEYNRSIRVDGRGEELARLKLISEDGKIRVVSVVDHTNAGPNFEDFSGAFYAASVPYASDTVGMTFTTSFLFSQRSDFTVRFEVPISDALSSGDWMQIDSDGWDENNGAIIRLRRADWVALKEAQYELSEEQVERERMPVEKDDDAKLAEAMREPVSELLALTANAEAGNLDAQLRLGEIFAEGIGVGRNVQEAMKWYYRAIRQGSSEAQYRAAMLTSSQTQKWNLLVMAEEKGHEGASIELDRITAEEVEQQRKAEQVERDRIAAENAERERLAAEQAEHERLAAQQIEREQSGDEVGNARVQIGLPGFLLISLILGIAAFRYKASLKNRQEMPVTNKVDTYDDAKRLSNPWATPLGKKEENSLPRTSSSHEEQLKPRFSDYLSAVLSGVAGVIAIAVLLVAIWLADAFIEFIPPQWNFKPLTTSFRWVFYVSGVSSFFLFSWLGWEAKKMERACEKCGAGWSLAPNGKEEIIDIHREWRSEERTEKKYNTNLSPPGWYIRSVFYEVLYEITEYDELIECEKCFDITKRRKNREKKIREEVTSATPWQKADSDFEKGKRIGKSLV